MRGKRAERLSVSNNEGCIRKRDSAGPSSESTATSNFFSLTKSQVARDKNGWEKSAVLKSTSGRKEEWSVLLISNSSPSKSCVQLCYIRKMDGFINQWSRQLIKTILKIDFIHKIKTPNNNRIFTLFSLPQLNKLLSNDRPGVIKEEQN